MPDKQTSYSWRQTFVYQCSIITATTIGVLFAFMLLAGMLYEDFVVLGPIASYVHGTLAIAAFALSSYWACRYYRSTRMRCVIIGFHVFNLVFMLGLLYSVATTDHWGIGYFVLLLALGFIACVALSAAAVSALTATLHGLPRFKDAADRS